MTCTVIGGGGRLQELRQGLALRWRSSATRPWGDGLLEQSLTTQSHSADWADVTEDDLVQYQPWFAASRTASRSGLNGLLRDRLSQRAVALHAWLQGARSRIADNAAQLLQSIASEAGATIERGDKASAAPLSPSGWPQQTDDTDTAMFELAVFIAMARLTTHAEQASVQVSWPDALVATIHTRINAAYVVPELEVAHETLATGAWLGVLLTGRAALCPPDLAWPANGGADGDPIARLLTLHAELAGASRCLQRLSKTRVSPLLVTPRRGYAKLRPTIWDPTLSIRIRTGLSAGRLDDQGMQPCRTM